MSSADSIDASFEFIKVEHEPAHEDDCTEPPQFKGVEELWDELHGNDDVVKIMRDNTNNRNVTFSYYFRTPAPAPNTIPGIIHAQVNVRTKNLPRLMTSGFRFSSANALPGTDEFVWDGMHESSAEPSRVPRHGVGPWVCRRIQIQHRPRDPEWAGWVHFLCHSMDEALRMNVDCLVGRLPCSAQCFGGKKGAVYCFEEGSDPDICFNTIYPDKLLHGSWPWPRGEASDEVELSADTAS
ncbi:hypothetical protein N3K66_008447 [Trichothecium roseum]|uniref:Uncharacterized protein n=1 Tax=Trichothecium roseum TaxID=47278 RepID=A0ACC0UQG2_9HYPO|nr:hypothetical protein N3K66_008447 [Trichothecium roseum]